MKKKISLMLFILLAMVTFTACGTDPTTVDYNGVSYTELEQESQYYTQTLMTYGDAEFQQYQAYKDQGTYTSDEEVMIVDFVLSWQKAAEGLGTSAELGDFTVTKAGNTLTTDQVVHYPGRDLLVTLVYSYYDMSLTGISVDKVYTLGEKMSKAGLNTLMGMGTVFVVLVLISLIISCFNIFPYLQKKKQEQKKTTSAAPVGQVETPTIIGQEVAEDDLEIAAVIAAAIAASTGTSTDSFVVRSISRRR